MNPTKIEYLDYTWNPLVGCNGIQCAVAGACWAKGQAKRRKHDCSDCYMFKPHYHLERLGQPFAVKKPSRIGTCYMGDLFDGAAMLCEPHQRIFEVIEAASWHTFLVLTKQPQNIPGFRLFPDNMWLGVSVNRVGDLWRIDELRKRHAILRFVSFEPLFDDVVHPGKFVGAEIPGVDLAGIDWVIIGAQRRPTIQPLRQWVLDLINEARHAGAKVFLKNNLDCRSSLLMLHEIPEVKS